MLLEICVDDEAGVYAAIAGGADRIELCSALSAGGLTPSVGFMRWACAISPIPVMVMIRPHDHGFHYTEHEVAGMVTDIQVAREAGAAGVVWGCLDADRKIDLSSTQRLLDAARGMDVTFHRAFDLTPDPIAAIDSLVQLDIPRVLTSGQASTVHSGQALIERLLAHAVGRIAVMPGGGLLSGDTKAYIATSTAVEFHASAGKEVQLPGTLDQLSGGTRARRQTDVGRVRMLRGILDRVAER